MKKKSKPSNKSTGRTKDKFIESVLSALNDSWPEPIDNKENK